MNLLIKHRLLHLFVHLDQRLVLQKLYQKKKEELKQLCTTWIAGSMRPFRIVTDPGFKRIIQACLDIGKKKNNKYFKQNFFFI
jgi:hypothetical protein